MLNGLTLEKLREAQRILAEDEILENPYYKYKMNKQEQFNFNNEEGHSPNLNVHEDYEDEHAFLYAKDLEKIFNGHNTMTKLQQQRHNLLRGQVRDLRCVLNDKRDALVIATRARQVAEEQLETLKRYASAKALKKAGL